MKLKSLLLKQTSGCEKTVSDRFEELKDIIEKQCSEKVAELRSAEKERKKEIEMVEQDTDRQKVILETFISYQEELLTKGSACDVARYGRELVKRCDAILGSKEEFDVRVEVEERNIGFVKRNVEDLASCQVNLVGKISINGKNLRFCIPKVDFFSTHCELLV